MPAVKGGSYGGVSAADRQKERRRRLLAAGLDVIGEGGLSSATVRAVCREAGLSSRFFYENFSSVDELAAELIDQIFQCAIEAVLAAVAGGPADVSARNRIAIETFVRELTDDPRAARFILIEASGNEALSRRRRAMVRSAVEAGLDQKRSSQSQTSEAYREVVLTVLIGGLIELLVTWMHGLTDTDLPRIIDEYVQLANEISQHRAGT